MSNRGHVRLLLGLLVSILLLSVTGGEGEIGEIGEIEPTRLECVLNLGSYGHEEDMDRVDRWVQHESTKELKAPERWILNDTACPLHDFDVKSFASKGIGCGKSMLVVGDSTMEHMFLWFRQFMPVSHATTKPCRPAHRCREAAIENHQSTGLSCHANPHIFPEIKFDLTGSETCQSTMKHITHDFLDGTHGTTHRELCSWMDDAHNHDYLLVSMGQHIGPILEYPYGVTAPDDLNATSLLQKLAESFVDKLEGVVAKNPNITIIWITAGGGHENFTTLCSPINITKPDAINAKDHCGLGEDTGFGNNLNNKFWHWEAIFDINDIYKRALFERFKGPSIPSSSSSVLSSPQRGGRGGEVAAPKDVLFLDMRMVQKEMRHCMKDYVHYPADKLESPYYQHWQFVYNLLEAYNEP